MASNDTPEPIVSQSVLNTDDRQDQGNDGQQIPIDNGQSTVDPGRQRCSSGVLDSADSLAENSAPLGHWAKLVEHTKTVFLTVTLLPMLAGYLLLHISEPKTNSTREEDQQQLEDVADTTSLPHSTDQSRTSPGGLLVLPPVLQNVIARYRRIMKRWLPVVSVLFRAMLIAGTLQRPKLDPRVCAARKTDTGFIGNADLYGLGVRTGLYLQWAAAILAIKFLPSARKFVVGSYLFYHFGIIVALYLLVLPDPCTSVAEVSLVFQLLWSGGALVLVPSQLPGTKMDSASKYFIIDLISIVMSFSVYAAAFWYYLNLYFHQFFHHEKGLIDTSECPQPPSRGLESFANIYVFWIVNQLIEMFETCHEKARIYMFSEIGEWNWHTSANLATTSLAMLLNTVFKIVLFALAFVNFIVSLFTTSRESDSHSDDCGGGTLSSILEFSKTIAKFIRKWYWLFRALIILAWSIMQIESTIQAKNISGVQSLNSTGQVMPLAIGVVTVFSLIYLWVKDFFSKARQATTEDVALVNVEPAIGMSTPSGRWI